MIAASMLLVARGTVRLPKQWIRRETTFSAFPLKYFPVFVCQSDSPNEQKNDENVRATI